MTDPQIAEEIALIRAWIVVFIVIVFVMFAPAINEWIKNWRKK